MVEGLGPGSVAIGPQRSVHEQVGSAFWGIDRVGVRRCWLCTGHGARGAGHGARERRTGCTAINVTLGVVTDGIMARGRAAMLGRVVNAGSGWHSKQSKDGAVHLPTQFLGGGGTCRRSFST